MPRPHVSGSGKPRNISDAIRTSRSDRRPSTSTPTRASCKEEGAGSGKSRDLQVVLDEMRNLGKGFGGGRLLGGMDAATMRGTSMGGRGQPTLCTEREAGENTGGVAMTTAGGKGGEGSRGQVARPGTGSEESERRLQSRRDRAGASDDAERIEGILRTG